MFVTYSRVLAFAKLVRLDYSLFGALGVVISGLLAADLQGLQVEYLVAFLIVLLSAIGSFAVNDYADVDVDTKNNRLDRPLVAGLISRRVGLLTGVASLLLIIVLSQFLNLIARAIIFVSLPVFFLYSFGLKKRFLLKNAIIAYAYVATIFLGDVVVDMVLEPLVVFFAVMGFVVGLSFEIMLDSIDEKGDRALGIDTIATTFGVPTANRVSAVLFAVIMLLDPLPFFLVVDSRLHLDYIFLLTILIPVISYFFTSRSLLANPSKDRLLQLKKRVFLTMQVGCVAYLIGVLL